MKKGEALLDLMLTTRKEVIEFTILSKKKNQNKNNRLKRKDQNSYMQNKFCFMKE